MVVLRIRHPVMDFDRWKSTFDRDPLDRRGSDVQGYVIRRDVDDPDFVEIDLQFAGTDQARRMLGRLREMWASSPAGLTAAPDASILETVEEARLT